MGELWGLGVHPTRQLFVTASDDKSVKVWDMKSKKMVASKTLKLQARSSAFSHDGNLIAVGYINGSFGVLKADSPSLDEVYTDKPRKEAIQDIKFSPNGKYLAVASHDNFVDIYDTEKWARVGKCSGSSSYITHVDWAEDSELLMTNSGAYEQLFFRYE